jgi:hypothetical protein
VFEVLDNDWTDGKKLAEYEALGIPQVRMVDPDRGTFIRYLNGGWKMNERTFSHEHIAFELAEIAALLQH